MRNEFGPAPGEQRRVHVKLLLGIMAPIFLAEFSVMLYLDRFVPSLSVFIRAFTDSAVIFLVSYAVLYRFSYKPLLSEISGRRRAEDALQKSHDGIESTVRDRTESLQTEIENRKAAETALRKSEEQYRGVVDNIGVGVAVINRNMEIMTLNRKMKEWFPAIDMAQKPVCHRVIHDPPREEPCSFCPTSLTLRDGQTHDALMETPTGGGTVYFRIVSSPLRDPSGNIVAALDLFDDITEQKRAEQEIRSLNDELNRRVVELDEARMMAEAASRAKSEFFANMSHELTTPLTAVIGFSQVLQDGLYGDLNGKQKEYVADILDSGMRLMGLLNDMLDLTKIESGDRELRVSRFLLKDVLQSSLTMFSAEAIKHNLHLDLDLEPGADVEIETDPGKLAQVLFNLLSNAVKFTPEGGSVRVSARLTNDEGRGMRDEKSSVVQASDASGRPSSIEISVTDTGIGIKPGDFPRLFQGVGQLESPYTKKYGGAGIGLILTKKLAALLGGKIRVESEQGRGSTFRFVIPCGACRGTREAV